MKTAEYYKKSDSSVQFDPDDEKVGKACFEGWATCEGLMGKGCQEWEAHRWEHKNWLDKLNWIAGAYSVLGKEF